MSIVSMYKILKKQCLFYNWELEEEVGLDDILSFSGVVLAKKITYDGNKKLENDDNCYFVFASTGFSSKKLSSKDIIIEPDSTNIKERFYTGSNKNKKATELYYYIADIFKSIPIFKPSEELLKSGYKSLCTWNSFIQFQRSFKSFLV